MASIFVQISAYRDRELTRTIIDAIEKSTGNHEINFGVHFIYLNGQEVNLPDLRNVKYKTSKAPENVGVGVGRYIAHQFYNNEDYYFQCDSHSRFVEGWDEIAINSILNYQKQGIEKPLLTMYPANYWYKDNTFTEIETDLFDPDYKTIISFSENTESFKSLRIPSQTAIASNGEIFTRSISAGSLFTVGPFMPPNKDMAFWGEEILMAARAYTHGYDLVVPDQQYLYHLYYNHDNPEINRRKIFWADFPDEFEEMNNRSREVLYEIFLEERVGDGYLGTERSLSEYGNHVGLDFVNGEVLETE
jgi:hypothetical protein